MFRAGIGKRDGVNVGASLRVGVGVYPGCLAVVALVLPVRLRGFSALNGGDPRWGMSQREIGARLVAVRGCWHRRPLGCEREVSLFAVKMIRDRDEQSPATRGCVFTAHGARDDLRQGGSSGCPGLWPGGDLALNMAFQNDVAVACPHRRTTMRCRAIHFHAPGWNADAPSMSVWGGVGRRRSVGLPRRERNGERRERTLSRSRFPSMACRSLLSRTVLSFRQRWREASTGSKNHRRRWAGRNEPASSGSGRMVGGSVIPVCTLPESIGGEGFQISLL